MPRVVIETERIGKRYFLGKDAPRARLTDLLHLAKAKEDRSFWALRDISFNVEEGDSVGIVGRNGAGKSTLLKLLARITAPTEGRATVHGNIGALLEVGTGFHPDLSGRDNIFLSGMILGMSQSLVRSRFDEIVDFSGVEQFIDTPVKRYSSGMQVRLAFSVALYLNAQILIVDEVLAVGDMEFQRKSLGKLHETIKKDGRTVLFVSHGLGAVKSFCKRVLVLEDGRLRFNGATDEGLEFYRNSISLKLESLKEINLRDRHKRANGSVRCLSVKALDVDGVVRWSYCEGETIRFRIVYEIVKDVPDLRFVLRLNTPNDDIYGSQDRIIASISEILSREPLEAGYVGVIDVALPNVRFRSLASTLYIYFGNLADDQAYDVVDANVDLPPLFVRPRSLENGTRGLVSIPYQFRASEGTYASAPDSISQSGRN